MFDAVAGMEAMPIVTVNLWYDRAVMDEPFVGLPGRTVQWVFDKRVAFGGTASHLSLVSSGATEIVGQSNEALARMAAAEIEGSIPGARGVWPVRATVIREKQATFSLAPGQPPRPALTAPIPNLILAGDWTDTGLPATIEGAVVSGHRAARAVLGTHRAVEYNLMTSVILHYQEIALKGKNRPWFVARLVRNLRRATSDLDITAVRVLMGRIEMVLGPNADWALVRERLARVFGVGNFAKAGRAPLDVDAIAAEILKDLGDLQPRTFSVSARRADKRFPLTSPQIEREVGGRIKEARSWTVNLRSRS